MSGVHALMERIDPWRSRLHGWWASRSGRERLLLAILAAIAAVVALDLLVLRPLRAARAQAIARIRTDDAVRARILAAGPAAIVPAARRSGDAAAIVSSSAAAFGIALRDVTAAGGLTRARTGPVAYPGLIHWLADLARTSDVRVERMALVRGPAPGTVIADLAFARS